MLAWNDADRAAGPRTSCARLRCRRSGTACAMMTPSGGRSINGRTPSTLMVCMLYSRRRLCRKWRKVASMLSLKTQARQRSTWKTLYLERDRIEKAYFNSERCPPGMLASESMQADFLLKGSRKALLQQLRKRKELIILTRGQGDLLQRRRYISRGSARQDKLCHRHTCHSRREIRK